MTTPVDHEVRKRATDALDRSIALSAGAGSGKTSVLATRIVNLLASGGDPSRIAAITFTEKAAGELQARVRDSLEARLRSAPDEGVQRGLDRFHELTLSTIHSFCRSLLAREPLVARWAPGTELEDGELHGLGPALSAWRHDWLVRAPRTLAVFDARLAEGSLRKLVATLIENRDLRPAVSERRLVTEEDWTEVHAELVRVREEIEVVAARCRAPATCLLYEKNVVFRQRLSDWCATPGDGTFDALVSGDSGSRQGGKAKDWTGDGVAAFKRALDAIDAWRARTMARAHGELVRSLEGVVDAVLTARRLEAKADFSDLLFRAARLLEAPEARTRLASRYDALLIDEVQDTDPIQAQVATLLARSTEHDGHWAQHPPLAGKLFAVGDPKQSIYRFRRADVEVWQALRDVVAKDGHADELVQNFRSVPGVVAWVNHVFADMPGFSPQVAHRGAGAIDPVVIVSGGPTIEKLEIEDETELAVRHLLALRRGKAQVLDAATAKPRDLRWSDVMVLVPRWTNTEAIAATLLRARIPCVVDGGSTFFKDPAIRAMTAALRSVDEPAANDATAEALEGLFGLTLEDLARHVAAGGSLRYTIEAQPAGPVSDALAQLRGARRGFEGSWVPVVDELLDATRAAAVWSILRKGPAHLANLDKLRAILRKLEETSRSPTAVIDELSRLAWDEEEKDLARIDPDTDAVRVTTIFSAKGLEAPVVVLLDMQRKADAVSVVIDRAHGTLLVKAGVFAPADWEAAEALEKAALDEERRRWMYVAATRARDQLVVVRNARSNLLAHLEGGWSDAPPPADRTEEIAPDVAVLQRRADLLDPPEWIEETFPGRGAAVDAAVESPPGRGDPAGEARAIEVRDAIRASSRRVPRWRSVGELAAGRRAPADVHGTGQLGTAGGVVVHRTMEALDLLGPVDALADAGRVLATQLATEAGFDDDLVTRVADTVAGILAHPVLTEIRAAREHWKEVPFAFHQGSTVVAGTIDLCFPEDAERSSWVVVDWKSDVPPIGHPMRDRYEAQLAKYAQALLATITPCVKVRTVLAGPHTKLPQPSAAERAHEEVTPALREMLAELLDAGAPVPQVGVDVGDPVIAQLELYWEEQQIGVGIALGADERAALAKAGITLIDANTPSVSVTLLAALGLARAAEADDTAETA